MRNRKELQGHLDRLSEKIHALGFVHKTAFEKCRNRFYHEEEYFFTKDIASYEMAKEVLETSIQKELTKARSHLRPSIEACDHELEVSQINVIDKSRERAS